MSHNEEDNYPAHERSQVHRYPDRARYDYNTIHGILSSTPVWYVAFAPSPTDPFPTILPMIGCIGSYEDRNASIEDSPMDLYLHGAAAARLLQLPSSEQTNHEGLPLAISATLMDGYVLALTPMHHSMNYRSAVIHGYANTIKSPEERLWAMELVTNSVVPKRWQNSRVPPTKSELDQTGILKVRIVSASAKVRSGGPGEDRRDEKDPDVREKVWTGVVPTWTAMGDPVPADENCVEELPGYLSDWRDKHNNTAQSKAERAVHR